MPTAEAFLASDALPPFDPTSLVYRGTFLYPEGDDWAYSGHALAYYPAGDPSGPDMAIPAPSMQPVTSKTTSSAR